MLINYTWSIMSKDPTLGGKSKEFFPETLLLYKPRISGTGVEHEILKYRFIHLKKRLVLLVSRKTRPLAGGC